MPKPSGSGGTGRRARPRRSRRARSAPLARRPPRSAAGARTRRGRRPGRSPGRRPKVEREVRPPPWIARDLAAQRLRDPADEITRRGQRQALPRPVRLRLDAARIRCSVAGPIPGTRGSAPSRATRRKSSGVSTPSAAAISSIRFGETPRRRPRPTSSGRARLRSSSSSAIVPLSASSRRRAEIPGPIPRRSRSRPVRTSSMIGAFVSRIVAAARRYAREAYGVDSARSRRAANASSSAATVALSRSESTCGQCDDHETAAFP